MNNRILIGLSMIMGSVISSALQLMLQVLVVIAVYLIAVMLMPNGLLSSIVAVIPIALSLVLTLSGLLCLIYFFILTPALQLVIAFKREGVKQSEGISNIPIVKKLTALSYIISIGNGLLIGGLMVCFII